MPNPSRLEQAYDPKSFRDLGHQLVDQLADHLENLEDKLVIDWSLPEEELDFWQSDFQQGDPNNLHQYFDQLIQRSIRLHHPRYIGHQISPPAYLAALSGLLADLLNNGMGVYEMGTAATAIERVVIQQLAGQIGFEQHSDGFLTAGGTLANLTALLAARQYQNPNDIWTNGQQEQLALMVCEEAHYC
ncbi:MAG: pyridoxal-dependent decarboxylase, partial [Bacteroidota bacterium]